MLLKCSLDRYLAVDLSWFEVLISASFPPHFFNQMVEGKATDWIQPLKTNILALEMQKNSILCLLQLSQKSNKSESRRTGSWPWNVGKRSCSGTASRNTTVMTLSLLLRAGA